jgi:prepilin-type N-terminal cleavage/methylation domain-containing protein
MALNLRSRSTPVSAFTLIELSIVLVIIGLLTSGILAGKELIQAAEIRAMMGRLEQYNTAAMAFRNKYNALPGDISDQNGSLGFVPRTITAGEGDDDGHIGRFIIWLDVENMCFWIDLLRAGLLNDSLNNDCPILADFPVSDSSKYFPHIPGNAMSAIHIGYIRPELTSFAAAISQYQLGNAYLLGSQIYAVSPGSGDSDLTFTNGSGIYSPVTALQVDTKYDDGMARTGRIRYVEAIDPPFSSLATGPHSCLNPATPTQYNNLGAAMNEKICDLLIRAGF